MDDPLHGKKVLVIGGTSGIGAAAATAFAQRGAVVTVASRDPAKAGADIGRYGQVRAEALDITDTAAVEAFCARAGQFDHVVISAAQTATGPLRSLPLADAQAAMDSKFWGAYRIARSIDIAAGGSLTFVSGYLSVRPSASSVLQGAINAALEALARGLALELAPVRVNTVSPGLIATPLWDKLAPDARDAMYANAAQRLPARRVGQPEDVANAIVYLAATRYATGSTVLVDGGGAIA
ncbi:SDR family oxidoreductase [Burkholderia latens]|uniref:SDR family oxidoreductase n=1 Tax=Burkholderia TaxID=32008 RepID=UPI00084204C8|nr:MULTISPECIES: SDR family oxidoreductase [Burkholderia]MBR7961102.1 SDR family oxidoreductase [Burkholderia vietnamiensis]AOK04268.1 short-chain dehydrogenase [Burkholderia latens]MBY4694609.1 SDR family oxidoreductase [Burkholderia latens]MCA8312462.1 SDR family oxidoreductase [Burkholderia sp. AU28942]QTO49660.1 SDR family oxidoreductase [Burkholderia latens]